MLVILKTDRDVLELYQQRFRYILVDEYQDTNSRPVSLASPARPGAQEHLLRRRRRPVDLFVARRAGREHPQVREGFPRRQGDPLEQNYRSTPHILAAASGVIANNSGRLGKTLWTDKDQGEKVKVLGVWDGPEEARRVGEEIEGLQRGGKSLDDMAILVRAQHQTREFEDRFIAIGLPYRIIGGFRFYERAEIRDALAYLRVVAQPADDLAFERIVNVPKRGLGDKALAKVHQYARAAGIPLTTAAARILDTDELTPQARRALGNLVGDIARWRSMGDDPPPSRARPHHPRRERLHRDVAGRSHRRGRRPPREPQRARPRDGGIRDARRVPRACQPRHGQ
jgi:DNA helicase-2/ATP-dependent DNA helicase PcrA